MRLWDTETGRCLRVLEGHADQVWSVAWGADQRHALSGSWDNTVRLWDTETGRCLRVLEGTRRQVWSVAWGADQRRALSGSSDKTVRLWDTETGRCLRVLEGHTSQVWSVAWGADQRRALSGSSDKTIRLWDMETGRCLRVLKGHADDVMSVAWSADQRRAFSGDAGGGIRVWDVSEFVTEARAAGDAATALAAAPRQVQYTNAKVILVGDTGVGKSGLAERLVNKRFVPTKSSHARKAYVLESKVVQGSGGVSVQSGDGAVGLGRAARVSFGAPVEHGGRRARVRAVRLPQRDEPVRGRGLLVAGARPGAHEHEAEEAPRRLAR